jgi:PEP-CTERM motif
MKKLVLVFLVLFLLSGTWAFADTILTTSSSTYVGSVNPGSPSSTSDELTYIQTLLTVGPGDTLTVTVAPHTWLYTRSSNTGPFPAVTAYGNSSGTTQSTGIDVSGFDYLLAKYGDVSYVWYVGGLTEVDIPSTLGVAGGLSHWDLFDGNTSPVPEPTSMALLGTGLFGMAGAIRRKLRK